MSKVFVSRQPIFDKRMNLYGYELFYQGCMSGKEENSDQASAKLLDDILYEEFDDLIDRKRGFIRFSEKLILAQIPLIFPKDKLIVQIENASVTAGQQTISVCKKLKDMGYMLALCIFEPEEYESSLLLPCADIIKVVYSRDTIRQQKQLIKNCRQRVMLVAENLECPKDFQNAVSMGYHLFQGCFFSEPVMTNAQAIGSLSNILVLAVNELYKPEPDYRYIEELFESDVEMSYKLLRLANSAFYGTRYVITSIRQALVHIGTQKLIRWSHLMLIRGIANAKNAELVKTSLIRGKLLALLCDRTQRAEQKSDLFITGIFSSIDVLLGENIGTIMDRLPISKKVKDALLGQDNELKNWLDAIIDFEKKNWRGLESFLMSYDIRREEFMTMYMQALKWCMETNRY